MIEGGPKVIVLIEVIFACDVFDFFCLVLLAFTLDAHLPFLKFDF